VNDEKRDKERVTKEKGADVEELEVTRRRSRTRCSSEM
jgi:hypothetical protein